MVTKCIINECSTMKSGDGVTLYKFPSNPRIQQEWFRAILNETGQTIFTEDDVICSKHFAPNCFRVFNGKTLLNASAIPFESLKTSEPSPKRIKVEKNVNLTCSVFSCKKSQNATSEKSHILYHPFPKNHELMAKWKLFCNNTDTDLTHSYVCSEHFTVNDYVAESGSSQEKMLKSHAIPTVYKKEATTEYENFEMNASNLSIRTETADVSASNSKADNSAPGTKEAQQKPDSITNRKNTENSNNELMSALTQYLNFKASKSVEQPKLKYHTMYFNMDQMLRKLPEEDAYELNIEFMKIISLKKGEKICVIENCQSRIPSITGVDYYPIPVQMNTRKTWMKLIQTNTKQEESDIPNNAFICSLHFALDCFKKDSEHSKKKILLPEAVPSIFPVLKSENDNFPVMSPTDLGDPQCVQKFYDWSLKNYKEQKKTIDFLKGQAIHQAKSIARLAKSVDDFKAKRYVSEEANHALQNLFDKIIDAQYDILI